MSKSEQYSCNFTASSSSTSKKAGTVVASAKPGTCIIEPGTRVRFMAEPTADRDLVRTCADMGMFN